LQAVARGDFHDLDFALCGACHHSNQSIDVPARVPTEPETLFTTEPWARSSHQIPECREHNPASSA
jgi:hypothetical protein